MMGRNLPPLPYVYHSMTLLGVRCEQNRPCFRTYVLTGALYASMHSAVSMDGNTYFADNLVQYNGGENEDGVFMFL